MLWYWSWYLVEAPILRRFPDFLAEKVMKKQNSKLRSKSQHAKLGTASIWQKK